MVKSRSSRLRPLMFWFTPITRSPAQKSACKDLKRNGQSPAITLKAAYTPTSNRAGSRSLSITRSPAQGPACKDLGRNGQDRAITTKATYTLVPNRAGSRSQKKKAENQSRFLLPSYAVLCCLFVLQLEIEIRKSHGSIRHDPNSR